MEEPNQFQKILQLLIEAQVNMVVVGGVAMLLRSADYATFDLDICYDRSQENVERICRVLAPYTPLINGAFFDTVSMLTTSVRNEIFDTSLGRVDFLARVSGLGDYQDVLKESSPITVGELTLQILTVEGLIKAKEAANRPKDQMHLVMLRALKEIEDEEYRTDK